MLEPVRRPLRSGLALAGICLILLLFVDMHVARTATRGESTQSVGRAAREGPVPAVGDTLRVQVAGDGSLERLLHRELTEALQKAGLPFTTVVSVQTLPEATAGPFLLIDIDADSGVWTPFYASRRVKATFSFAYGLPLSQADVDDVLAVTPGPGQVRELGGGRFDRCPGPCASAQRRGEWSASAVGLVGLPYIRSLAAERLAREATALVLDGLPENYNRAKWADRAFTLVRERPGDASSLSFQELRGCRGGLVQTAASLLIYDANTDSLTEPLKVSDVLAALSADERLKGLLPYPRFLDGGIDHEAMMLTLGRMPDGREVRIRVPVEGCQLGQWQVVP